MEETSEEKRGYNIFQARLYSICDELVGKTYYIEKEAAINFLLPYFSDEHEGVLFSRAVIRCIDPILNRWIVPWATNNSAALLLDEEYVNTIDRWRIAFYDMGDFIMDTLESNKPISEETAKCLMIPRNAFYSVISGWEQGTTERFVISRIQTNSVFNLSITNFNPESFAAQQKKCDAESLAIRYQKLILQDQLETEQLNTQREKFRKFPYPGFPQ